MLTASIVPATVKSISLFSTSSTVGFITNFPSTLPTFTPATGPLNGISLMHTAKDDANNAADLILHMIGWDPNKRYSAEQCLNHPFFKEKENTRQ